MAASRSESSCSSVWKKGQKVVWLSKLTRHQEQSGEVVDVTRDEVVVELTRSGEEKIFEPATGKEIDSHLDYSYIRIWNKS